jgi:pimeloyl-ACP methyl ester carboxylesterase
VASAAADVAGISDALGIDRFSVMGHSGGGPHALACAALLPGRVLAVAEGSGLAPFGADGLDRLDGMTAAGAAENRAAAQGRAALEKYLAAHEFDMEQFTPADQAALTGDWAWLTRIAGQAIEGGPDGYIEDQLASVSPWGFDTAQDGSGPRLPRRRDRMVPSAHGAGPALPGRRAVAASDDGHVSVWAPAAS